MSEDVQSYQIGGDHYQKDIQPWDVIRCYELDFFEGSALKYLLRRKPGESRETDLRKARHYIDYLIRREVADGIAASFTEPKKDHGDVGNRIMDWSRPPA